MIFKFTKWYKWNDRNSINGLDHPGIYILAHFHKNIPLNRASYLNKEVVYIGETTDRTLIKRLSEFESVAFKKATNHSGGVSYKSLYSNMEKYNLHVAISPAKEPKIELRSLYIKYHERRMILKYAIKYGNLPKCNKK